MAAQQQSLLNVQSNLANVIKNIESNLFTRIQRLENNVIDKIESSSSNKNPDSSTKLYEPPSQAVVDDIFARHEATISSLQPGQALRVQQYANTVMPVPVSQTQLDAFGAAISAALPNATMSITGLNGGFVLEQAIDMDWSTYGKENFNNPNLIEASTPFVIAVMPFIATSSSFTVAHFARHDEVDAVRSHFTEQGGHLGSYDTWPNKNKAINNILLNGAAPEVAEQMARAFFEAVPFDTYQLSGILDQLPVGATVDVNYFDANKAWAGSAIMPTLNPDDANPSAYVVARAAELKALHADKLPANPGEVLMIVELGRSVALTADEQVAFEANGATYSTISGVTVTQYDSSSLLIKETIEIDDYTAFGVPWQGIFGDVAVAGYAASAAAPANGTATTLDPNTYLENIAAANTFTRQYIFTYPGEREAVLSLWNSTASSPTFAEMSATTQEFQTSFLQLTGVTDPAALAAAQAAFPTAGYLANAKSAVEFYSGGYSLVVQEA